MYACEGGACSLNQVTFNADLSSQIVVSRALHASKPFDNVALGSLEDVKTVGRGHEREITRNQLFASVT